MIDNLFTKVYNCPRCGTQMEPSKTLSGSFSRFWVECPKCNTYHNTFRPQPHQQLFHTDPHRFKGNFGGFGSGKTSTSLQEIYKHIFLTPGGTGLVGAAIYPQIAQTILRDLEEDFPVHLVESRSIQQSYITFVNGYRLLFRPFDEPGKLRSLNLDLIVIVEGSEIKPEFFSIAKTRLRNLAATALDPKNPWSPHPEDPDVLVPNLLADWREMWTESNPDAGWVKTDIVDRSSLILKHGGALYNPPPIDEPENIDDQLSSHITATAANKYLPETYFRDNAKGKPQWWINRYLLGSFAYSEGLVYPSAINNARLGITTVVPTRQPPRDAKYILAHDYGLADPTGILLAYIDPGRNKLVIHREYKKEDNNLKEIVDQLRLMTKDVPSGAWLRPWIIDPKSGLKRDYNKKSLIDHYAEYGIFFQPGQINLDAGIYKVNTYFEEGYIEIEDCCQQLIKELQNYRFPSDNTAESGKKDKPEDKNNHLCDPLRWIVMELPKDPTLLSYDAYAADGRNLKETIEKDMISARLIMSDMAPPQTYQPQEQNFDIFSSFENDDDEEGGPLW